MPLRNPEFQQKNSWPVEFAGPGCRADWTESGARTNPTTQRDRPGLVGFRGLGDQGFRV